MKRTEKNAVRFENYLRAMSGQKTMRMHYDWKIITDFSNSSPEYFKNYALPPRPGQTLLRIDPSPPPPGIIRDATNTGKPLYMPYDTRTQKFVFNNK